MAIIQTGNLEPGGMNSGRILFSMSEKSFRVELRYIIEQMSNEMDFNVARSV